MLNSRMRFSADSPAAKSKNISLCREIMKLGTLVGDPCRIIFRLGPNSETPPGGRHFEFQYGRHIAHTFAYNYETKADTGRMLGIRDVNCESCERHKTR